MSFLDSRFIGLVDVPDPKSIEARFVYNFFVPDERTNRAGDPRFHGVITERIQRSINDKVMEVSLPRFVEIQFDQVNSGDGNIEDLGSQPLLSEEKQNVDTEENISSDNDVSFRFRDTPIRGRIKGKAEILAKMMNADMNDVSSQISTITNLNENINVTELQQVLSPAGAPGVTYVNEVGDLFNIPVFTQAATLSIDMLLERRLLRTCFDKKMLVLLGFLKY